MPYAKARKIKKQSTGSRLYPIEFEFRAPNGQGFKVFAHNDKELSEIMITAVGQYGAKIVGHDGRLWGAREIVRWAELSGIKL